MREYYETRPNLADAMPPGIKWILIANGAIFVVQIIAMLFQFRLELFLGLSNWSYSKGMFYQIFTYMWLHAVNSPMHILFNLLGLWMFGRELEQIWGTKNFVKYYLVSGIGAGLFILLLDFFFGEDRFSVTIGASGAVYGILLASALSWPNREVYLYFLFPVKMKWLLLGFGLISFLGLIGDNGHISHAGHLGGILVGFLYIQYRRRAFPFAALKFNVRKNEPESGFHNHSNRSQNDFSQRSVNREENKGRWGKVISINDYRVDNERKTASINLQTTKDVGKLYFSLSKVEKKNLVDSLLDSISRHGINSLSSAEKEFLILYSQEQKNSFH